MKKSEKSCNQYYVKPSDINKNYFYMGLACLVLSFIALYFSFYSSITGIIISVITIIACAFLYKKAKNPIIIALSISAIAFLVSLFIIIINVCIF